MFIVKIGKGENIKIDVLQCICKALNYDISDIMEFVNKDEIQDAKK
jgi:DNA-binding Xre family transcriptional regulator